MSETLETIKVKPEARKNIKLISALTDKTMADVVERLASEELDRLQKPQPKEKHSGRKRKTER